MKLTSREFRQMLNRGVIKTDGKKLKMGDVSPDYLTTLDKIDGIFIPGEVYSSKNNKRIWKKAAKSSLWSFKGKPARPFITDSKNVAAYKKDRLSDFKNNRDRWFEMISGLTTPYVVEFTFYRRTKSMFDFNNMTQLIQDMMVNAYWIEDDNIMHILPIPPLPPKPAFIVDKENPGVLINIVR
jgi:hypothetical protein